MPEQIKLTPEQALDNVADVCRKFTGYSYDGANVTISAGAYDA